MGHLQAHLPSKPMSSLSACYNLSNIGRHLRWHVTTRACTGEDEPLVPNTVENRHKCTQSTRA